MVKQSIASKIKEIESIIGQDDGDRGMKSLIVPNDLCLAAQHIVKTLSSSTSSTSSSSSTPEIKHVVILSGFPCCVNHDPPTETDGPPGTIAIAKCILGLAKKKNKNSKKDSSNYHVRIVTDECNQKVFQAAIDAHLTFEHKHDLHTTSTTTSSSSSKNVSSSSPKIELQTFPNEQQMTEEHYTQMENIIHDQCDVLIACERAGPGQDGNCYTMRGINMTSMNLIAPLHYMVDKLREYNHNLSLSSSMDTPHKKFIAIGDGGNELGMGKVIDEIYNNPKITNGQLIGAVTSADYLIAASVSNWGGYALAATCALVSYDEERRRMINDNGEENENDDDNYVESKDEIKDWIDHCVPCTKHEIHLLNSCVDVGCRDGVSGKVEATVDGMPLETSLDCLQRIIDTCLQ